MTATTGFRVCAGGSPGREYSSILGVPVSLSGSTTFCTGNSITLVATAISGYSYQWQRNHVNIPEQTSPYIDGYSGWNICRERKLSGMLLFIGLHSINSSVTRSGSGSHSVFRCGPGSLMLTATSTDTIYWFDAPGGNIISVGDTLNTSFLNATTTTYYAQTSLSCPSNQIPVEAGILDFTELPVTQDVSRCGTGSITLLPVIPRTYIGIQCRQVAHL